MKSGQLVIGKPIHRPAPTPPSAHVIPNRRAPRAGAKTPDKNPPQAPNTKPTTVPATGNMMVPKSPPARPPTPAHTKLQAISVTTTDPNENRPARMRIDSYRSVERDQSVLSSSFLSSSSKYAAF